jgi:hypothetical protein
LPCRPACPPRRATELPDSLKHAKMAKEMGALINNWCGPKRKLLEEMIKTDRAKRQQTRRGLF